MALTYVASATGQTSSSVESIACAGALNAAANDLIVALAMWKGADPTTTIAGGTNTLQMATVVQYTTNCGLIIGYKLAATADAAETFTASFGAARANVGIFVLQFRPDAGDTVTLDAGGTGDGASGSKGASVAGLSGNITTSATATDCVLIGAGANNASSAMSLFQLEDTAADGYEGGATCNYGTIWYRIVTAQKTNVHAQWTNPSSAWVGDICAFKSIGNSSVVVRGMMATRRRDG